MYPPWLADHFQVYSLYVPHCACGAKSYAQRPLPDGRWAVRCRLERRTPEQEALHILHNALHLPEDRHDAQPQHGRDL